MTEKRWTQPNFCKRYGVLHDLGSGDFGCAYWTVHTPITVWVYTGRTRESNVWWGNSNVPSQELLRVDLKPGDQIHAHANQTIWAALEGVLEAQKICVESITAFRLYVHSLAKGRQFAVKYV
jgi:hypothetical protein